MTMRKLPPFQNVGVSQTAVLPNLPLGVVYDGILLQMGGTTFAAANISEIRVRLDGKTIVEVSGAQLQDINDYMGRTADAAFLPLWFADINARTIQGENWGAIDTTLPYSSFSMEIDINGTAVAPTLEAWVIPGLPKVESQRAMFKAYLRSVQSISASGTHNLQPAVGRNTLLSRLHLFHANLTRLDVKRDGVEIQGDGETAPVQYLQNELNRTTQAGHFCFDPLVRNNQSQSLRIFRGDGQPFAMEYKATLSAADTVNQIAEVYGSIASI